MGAAFVGRDHEQAELLAGLKDAISGRGGVFLIEGEPGIGKTALAEHMAGLAAERGVRVEWSRAWQGDAATSFWAWAQILRSLTRGLDQETLDSLLRPGAAHLSRLVPELADRVGESDGSIRDPDSEAARYYLFEATTRFLKQFSSSQPLMLILDDLLAGDRSSLLLLRFLAQDIRTARLLVVATYREAESTQSTDVVELLADLLRDGYLLSLRALERDEVGRLIAEIAGVTPWAGKVEAIHEATGGNPLFVREVTRLLAGKDPLDRPGRLSIPVPESVRAVIRRRLSSLSSDAVQALSAATVGGRDFDLALVAAATGLSAECVLAALAEAVSLGIVAEAADAAGLYRFTHPLMREAIYDVLPLPARTHMHQRVGAAIELLHGADSPSHLGDLAYHFTRSAGLGESARAGEYAQRAGDRAMDACAYDEAVVQYRRALDASAIAGPVEPARRCELLLRLGWAQTRAGEYRDAKPVLLLAAEIARELGSAEHLARAALGIGEQLIEGGRVDGQLLALLEEAIQRLGPEHGTLRVRLLARLSLELTFADEARRDPPSMEAIRIARRLGDPGALGDALRARWMARWGPDGLEERSALAEELIAVARESGDREKELIGLAQRATCSLESGDGPTAASDISTHAQRAAELRMPYHEWAAATTRAGQALLTGSLEEVEQLAQDALDRLPGRSNALLAYHLQLSVLRWEQGRLGELRAEWEGLATRLPQLGYTRAWLCLASHQQGQDQAAQGVLQDLIGGIASLPRDGFWLTAVAVAALAARDLEDRDSAAELYSLLLPYGDRGIVLPMLHPALCLGSVSFYLGLLAAETESWDEAEHHCRSAIQMNQRLGATPFLARTHFEVAHILVRRGRVEDRDRAHEHLDRSAALAATVGSPQLMERIERLRQREVPTAAPLGDQSYVFRKEGDFWTINYHGDLARLRDSKGLRCLARLLAQPGQEILALELETTGVAEAQAALRADSDDAGELLDAQAKSAYRERLDELREEIEEAESFNDPERAARALEERDLLTRELARAVGLGGRDRKAASHAERARLNVTRAIRAALKNVERVHPSLAEHLSLTIRTGRYCSYTPDPRVPIRWEF